MGKTTRRTKQANGGANISPSASASPSASTANSVSSAAEQYERRIHDLEEENRAYQVVLTLSDSHPTVIF